MCSKEQGHFFILVFEMNCNCSNYLHKEQEILEKDWTLENLLNTSVYSHF